MVVVSVSLAGWICVVWWQDVRTMREHTAQLDRESNLEEAKSSHDQL